MEQTQITLNLKKQCIQTAAKRRYEILMQSYFRRAKSFSQYEKDKMESEIASILFFLENADFHFLRDRYPELSGIEEVSVDLKVDHEDGYCTISIGSNVIDCVKKTGSVWR